MVSVEVPHRVCARDHGRLLYRGYRALRMNVPRVRALSAPLTSLLRAHSPGVILHALITGSECFETTCRRKSGTVSEYMLRGSGDGSCKTETMALSMTRGLRSGSDGQQRAPRSSSVPGARRRTLRERSPSGCWRYAARRVGDQRCFAQHAPTGLMQAPHWDHKSQQTVKDGTGRVR